MIVNLGFESTNFNDVGLSWELNCEANRSISGVALNEKDLPAEMPRTKIILEP
jgi:hypothetical protein